MIKRYHVQIDTDKFLGPVTFDSLKEATFKHVDSQRQAYCFNTKSFAVEIKNLIKDKFPKAKVIIDPNFN